jgi:putative transcriptional regulator
MGIAEYGQIKLQIEELLQEKHISKNRICKELDIPRTNLNRYCNNKFQRIDAMLLCKLCSFLNVDISELIKYIPPNSDENIK